MPSITHSVVLAILFISAPIWAKSNQLTDRVITPSTFLGVDLQGDFISEVPECGPGDETLNNICRVATKKAGLFEVRGLPYLPISPGYKFFAAVKDGAVSQLVLTGKASNLYLIEEMLTDKLGMPTSSAPQWVQLKSGASYDAERIKWSTQGVAVEFGRDPNDLGRYLVTFSNSVMVGEIEQNEVVPVAENL